MNYKKRFKRFTAELLSLIEKHMKEWEEAEQGGFDIDEVMDRVESSIDQPTEPVTYPKSSNLKKISRCVC